MRPPRSEGVLADGAHPAHVRRLSGAVCDFQRPAVNQPLRRGQPAGDKPAGAVHAVPAAGPAAVGSGPDLRRRPLRLHGQSRQPLHGGRADGLLCGPELYADRAGHHRGGHVHCLDVRQRHDDPDGGWDGQCRLHDRHCVQVVRGDIGPRFLWREPGRLHPHRVCDQPAGNEAVLYLGLQCGDLGCAGLRREDIVGRSIARRRRFKRPAMAAGYEKGRGLVLLGRRQFPLPAASQRHHRAWLRGHLFDRAE